MGRLNNARRAVAAAIIAVSVFLALTGCDNALMTYLLKGILYRGWQVTSWSTPAPVVAGETHETTGKSNGFPSNMAMGTNGMLHLIGWRVDAGQWIYTSMAPGAAQFNQPYKIVNFTPSLYPAGLMPGISLPTDDTPFVTYGMGDGVGNEYLYYQEYNAGTGIWGTPKEIANNGSNLPYAPAFVYLLSDLKSHIWYRNDGKFYHTLSSPVSPVMWLPDVKRASSARLGSNDVAFVFTAAANDQLFYCTWGGTAPTPIWTAPADTTIGEMTLTLDSNGAVSVSFGTSKTSDPSNPAFFALHFLTNAGGAWRELDSITGNTSAGPMPMYPCSMVVAPDRYGNDHLHIVYTIWMTPFIVSVWYSYYEESGWHAPQNLDTVHNSIMPHIAVDPAGVVHVVYSWYASETDRTLMYVRGTPGEAQNQ